MLIALAATRPCRPFHAAPIELGRVMGTVSSIIVSLLPELRPRSFRELLAGLQRFRVYSEVHDKVSEAWIAPSRLRMALLPNSGEIQLQTVGLTPELRSSDLPQLRNATQAPGAEWSMNLAVNVSR